MTWSIDTSALIHAWRRAYPRDVFPALWERIEASVEDGSLIASREVLTELETVDDGVLQWARDRDGMFVPTDAAVQTAATAILAAHPGLIDEKREKPQADPFVVAVAQVRACTVVTQETPTRNPARPHIPDVCTALGVNCSNLLAFFRAQGWAF